MSTSPFYIDTEDNPNEVFGVRACSFAGQQKHADCSGKWRTWHTINVANHRQAPKLTVCDYHRREAAADLFKTPTVTERKPKRVTARARLEEEVVAL